MKKIISALLAVVASSVFAGQTVSVVWPFNIGSTQANYARSLITEANRIQQDYTFVLENRPGAGSSIAANHVAHSKELAIMAATSSFFIRPNFFPGTSHNIQEFQPLHIQCAVPMIIVSKKYKSFRDVAPSQRITIGVSGLGTTTHLLTAEVKKKFPELTAVAYTGTMEPIKDVLGGNLDMAVGFPGELKQFIDNGQLAVIGVSGLQAMPGMSTLSKQGFSGASSVVNTHFLTVSKTVSKETVVRWQEIFNRASKSELVESAHAVDNCYRVNAANVDQWFQSQISYWQQVTKGIRID